MKKIHKTTRKLDKKLKNHTALMKNGSSIGNIGIKRVKKLLISVLSEISSYLVGNMSKSSLKFFAGKLLSRIFRSNVVAHVLLSL